MYSQSQLELALERFLNAVTDEEQSALLEEIYANTINPEWTDLIFQTDEFVKPDGSVDIPAVARKILDYKPILL